MCGNVSLDKRNSTQPSFYLRVVCRDLSFGETLKYSERDGMRGTMWEIVPNFSRHRSKFPLMAEHPRSKRVLLVTIQTLRGAF